VFRTCQPSCRVVALRRRRQRLLDLFTACGGALEPADTVTDSMASREQNHGPMTEQVSHASMRKPVNVAGAGTTSTG